MHKKLRVLFLEPYFGGSHQVFALGLQQNSTHDIKIIGLPARFWKWRMRAAALEFIELIKKLDPQKDLVEILAGFDLIIATTMMDLAQLKALLPRQIPIIAYFHENQLRYPRVANKAQQRDLHFAFTNISSALVSDLLCFNSLFQMDLFHAALEPFLQQMPDKRPIWVVEEIKAKSMLLYPGCDLPVELIQRKRQETLRPNPTILWNHRWEFDKQPELFFSCLEECLAQGFDFKLIVLGENFQVKPQAFLRARSIFADKIIHWGFQPNRKLYYEMLRQSDIVISCAIQENFGLAIIEAVCAGAWPILPNRLVYPELVPKQLARSILYDLDKNLSPMLAKILQRWQANQKEAIDPWASSAAKKLLQEHYAGFAWSNRISDFDTIISGFGPPKAK